MLYTDEKKPIFDDTLLAFIKENQNKKKVKAIIGNASLWNIHDESGNSLLHYAAESNNKDITQYLIESGSKVDARNTRGQTALIVAIEKKHRKIVKILLKAGANLEISDDSSRNAMQLVIDNNERMEEDIVQMILKRIRKDCYNDNQVIASRLLGAGWPIYCIVLSRNTAVVTGIILENDCSVGVYFRNQYRKTLIQTLAIATEEETCELLQDVSRRALQRFPLEQLLWTGNIIYTHQNKNPLSSLFRMQREWKNISLNRPVATPLSFQTQYAVACVIDHLLNEGAGIQEVEKRKCMVALLKFKSTVIYEEAFKQLNLIFRIILKYDFLIFGELLLAHLALQVRTGAPITECIRAEIDSNSRLKNYFAFCKRLLDKEVYESLTLFELLGRDADRFTYLAGNQEFVKATACFNESLKSQSYYFHVLLQRRTEKALTRKSAADVLCKLLRIDYSRFPNIADNILNYLTDQDIITLSKLRYVILPSASPKKACRILSWFERMRAF